MSRLQILIHFHFYRNFLVPVTTINLISGLLIQLSNSLSYAFAFGLIKILLNILIGILYHLSRGKSLYYYNNLGLSTISIYTGAMTTDLITWFCIVTLFNMI